MKARSVAAIKVAKYGYMAVSILLCIIGVFMILKPNVSAAAIGRLLGCTMLLFGIIKIVGYFSKDLFRLAFQYDLQLGLMTILLGTVTLIKTDNILNFISAMMGICIVVDCAFKMQTALDAKRFGIHKWWVTLSLSILSGILGISIIFCPANAAKRLTVLLGVLLIVDGIRNLCIAVTCVKIVKNQMPDVIDVDYYEIEE